MLDSLTIFSKGGLVLYQHLAPHENARSTAHTLNSWISQTLLDPTAATTIPLTHSNKNNNNNNNKQCVVLDNKSMVQWDEAGNMLAVAVHPQVLVTSRRRTDAAVSRLLQSVLHEYAIFTNTTLDATRNEQTEQDNASLSVSPSLFDATFQVLQKQALARNDTIEPVTPQQPPSNNNNNNIPRTNNKGKEKRVWGEAKVTKEAMAELDYSKDQTDGEAALEGSAALAEARAAYLPDPHDIPAWQEQETLTDEDDTTSADSSWGASLQSLMNQMAGTKVLTQQDLQAPLLEMRKLLTSKNVANDIAHDICHTVEQSLVGKRLQSFSRVKTAVREALERAIAKLLKPPKHREVQVLRAVVTKRDGTLLTRGSKRPYVICMVGINGVGKSTSLAKIAYYLKSNGCSPMLAACDTFRSGAVEQLNVHAKCLDVPLYHKGYAKDPSSVAQAAIAHATDEKHDVVLIDTAGRMQNNVPLMKALSKLLVENDCDLVLFVCEALVGNDGIDQLNMFNKAFRSGGHTRQIDGIVLTKFDTVGDKVGAALTMTRITGAPIVFCGTGQKYNHLKPLSVQSVIKSLFA